MDLKLKLGKRIKELRLRKNLSQEYMSEILEINPSNYSRIETGASYPRPENLEKICEILNVKPSELFDFEHFSSNDDKSKLLISAIQNNDVDVDLLFRIYCAIKK